MTQKIRFSIWFTLVLLAAFAVGYYAWSESLKKPDYESGIMNYGNKQVSSTPSEASPVVTERSTTGVEGWQTYRNEEYGFEVKYPGDWKPEHSTSFGKDGFFISQSSSGASIAILPNGEFDHGLPFDDPVVTYEQLSGKPVTVHTWQLEDDSYKILYFLTAEVPNWTKCNEDLKNCARFDLGAENEIALNEIKQILSTFRFIE